MRPPTGLREDNSNENAASATPDAPGEASPPSPARPLQTSPTSPIADPLHFLSRRKLLELGLWSLGAVASSAGAISLWRRSSSASSNAPAPGMRMLTERELSVVRAVACATIPTGGIFAAGAADLDLGRTFDEFIADEPEDNVANMRRALTLIDWGPVVFDGMRKRFISLDPSAQQTHWESWATSRWLVRRQVSIAFRKLFLLVFYDQPSIWPHIGYSGPSMSPLSETTP